LGMRIEPAASRGAAPGPPLASPCSTLRCNLGRGRLEAGVRQWKASRTGGQEERRRDRQQGARVAWRSRPGERPDTAPGRRSASTAAAWWFRGVKPTALVCSPLPTPHLAVDDRSPASHARGRSARAHPSSLWGGRRRQRSASVTCHHRIPSMPSSSDWRHSGSQTAARPIDIARATR
jgi:hypothetical protein